jgi:hypothetical protein
VLQNLSCDLDGDAISVVAVKRSAELEELLSPRTNYTCIGLPKLTFNSDSKFGLGPDWQKKYQALHDHYIATGDSAYCFEEFTRLEKLGLRQSAQKGGFRLSELESLHSQVQPNMSVEAFSELAVKHGGYLVDFAVSKATRFQLPNLYQMLVKLGPQEFSLTQNPYKTDEITSNLYQGLTTSDFIAHLQSGRESLIHSAGLAVSCSGMNTYRLGFSHPEIMVGDNGQIVDLDGRLVVPHPSDIYPKRLFASNYVLQSALHDSVSNKKCCP